MGLFDLIFKKNNKVNNAGMGYFETLTAYSPIFTTFNGCLYESELVRASIDAKARHNSKLKVEIENHKELSEALENPNPWQTWSQFLYRLSTILEMQNTAYIVPIYEGVFENVVGLYPILPTQTTLVKDQAGNPWIRYQFMNGKSAALRLQEVSILTKFQYKKDFVGESNLALSDTMDLIEIQKQGIQEGVKNASTYRFMASMSNFANDEDLAKERQRFSKQNFASEAKGGGLLLFPNTYKDIKQINVSALNINPEQMKLIQTNVFNYFGVNEDILQNKCNGDAWNAFYEGAIEPFAVQLSQVLLKMFKYILVSHGRYVGKLNVTVTANRLQYMSNKDKLNVTSQLMDRGVITFNEAREIFNLPPVDGGDVRTIRGEYKNTDDINNVEGDENNEE